MKLCKFIKKFRLSKNLSQKEFADKCGLDQSRISLAEKGILPIGYDTVEKIANATGKTVEEIRRMMK